MIEDIKLYTLASVNRPGITYNSSNETETLRIDTCVGDEINTELLKKLNH